MSTYIVISPDFPHININLCESLARAGIRVLGIGDAEHSSLDHRLKESIYEYYKVSALENYSEVYRAVALFAHKYGKPSHLDSNNSHWLNQDARLRQDFNIPGLTHHASDRDSLAIAAEAGLPVGEAAGKIFSWDAIIGADSQVLFEGVTAWPSAPAPEYVYRTVLPAPPAVAKMGRDAADALEAAMTFLHVQVAFPDDGPPRIIRVSRTAPPAFTLDMHNFAHNIDTYAIYAGEVARLDDLLTNGAPEFEPRDGITIYASRQDDGNYRYHANELHARWAGQIRLVARNPEQYRRGMGDVYYLAVVENNAEGDRFTAEVTERS